ncbi:hypothetical protein AB0F46_04755 [Streptomyces sp. NPDC026665]|uniref:hypothetical protein n=1 Tax=Streptomyces sp. NPDC026665 TaxID=3154798 RepID=UPI0033DA76D0
MISHPVEGAIFALQKRALDTCDTYQLDRIDRALDELLRNPCDDCTPAEHRVRSAMGHAYEVLERRKMIAPSISLGVLSTEHGAADQGYPLIEILEWLRAEPGIPQSQRVVLQALAHGDDAEALAARHGLSLLRARERISRARKQARQLWAASAQAA